ncbi:MAG: hypothetical protein WCV67_02700 [Victivallaceae bacterium]
MGERLPVTAISRNSQSSQSSQNSHITKTLCRTGVQSVGVGGARKVESEKSEKSKKHYVQRHSKVSESDGCPSGYAGRMGETVYAQRLSKVSESGEREKREK